MTDGLSELARSSRKAQEMTVTKTEPMEALKSCAWPRCKEPNGGRLDEDFVHMGRVVVPAGGLLRDPYCCGEHARRHEGDLHREALFHLTEFNRERPCWAETWMEVARVVSRRSYDPRLKVAAIVVPADNTGILAQGYNGNARGLPNEPESLEPGMSGMIHAEQNALIKCPFHFPVAKHMYVTHSPCRACAKLCINADIKRVVYGEMYRDASGLDLLRAGGIEVLSLEEAIAKKA